MCLGSAVSVRRGATPHCYSLMLAPGVHKQSRRVVDAEGRGLLSIFCRKIPLDCGGSHVLLRAASPDIPRQETRPFCE